MKFDGLYKRNSFASALKNETFFRPLFNFLLFDLNILLEIRSMPMQIVSMLESEYAFNQWP